ncbi:hypothetical protein NDU88_000891 [Pleurodeles waltl]|uniref:Uncharacterized protein n=1 Tax=Pleurodeles waltl TaxID=8319 RepID=A0AAV7NCP0_PLEWA|nr:hypothetical protein NDU88_000891 [Pleurodeles waltl]
MVLGLDTALERMNRLEISEDTALTNAKEALEALEKTTAEFTYITQQKKLDKLAKDLVRYDKNITYPYLHKDYYKQDETGKYVNRSRSGYRRYMGFSDTSATDSSDSEASGPNTDKTQEERGHTDHPEPSSFLGRGQSPLTIQRGRRGRGGYRGRVRIQETHVERQTRRQQYTW